MPLPRLELFHGRCRRLLRPPGTSWSSTNGRDAAGLRSPGQTAGGSVFELRPLGTGLTPGPAVRARLLGPGRIIERAHRASSAAAEGSYPGGIRRDDRRDGRQWSVSRRRPPGRARGARAARTRLLAGALYAVGDPGAVRPHRREPLPLWSGGRPPTPGPAVGPRRCPSGGSARPDLGDSCLGYARRRHRGGIADPRGGGCRRPGDERARSRAGPWARALRESPRRTIDAIGEARRRGVGGVIAVGTTVVAGRSRRRPGTAKPARCAPASQVATLRLDQGYRPAHRPRGWVSGLHVPGERVTSSSCRAIRARPGHLQPWRIRASPPEHGPVEPRAR